MATATLLGSSFAIPAAARRASSSASTSLGFATSQLAGLSLSAGAATPTAVAFLPKRQQLQPLSRVSLPFPLAVASLPNGPSGRVCPFTGKKTNRANKVSFSNHKTKKQQFVNLQYKKLWWEAGKRFVKLRLSTKALKTIEKHGLDAVARKAGIDLNKK
ncbi:50S ribosomal protein L28 chloroplastic [Zea mays]|uniref:Large ribosomal subunit protein bL28c n=1 Tax=Zea mays TaxID=4577 RepID=A0A1D6LYR8_MAIZE|nr:50S ribosomal protein L28 chloroplastic [Zea mays]